MIINNTYFSADLSDILTEWQYQLKHNNISLLNATRETPNDIMVSCIYHKNGQERKPSAGIKKSDGTFHCFACGETHSLQEVISHSFGYNDCGVFGWNWLLKNFLIISVEERKDVTLDFDRGSSTSISDMAIQNYVSEKELDSYRYYHPYMYKRKLTDEVIDLFDIGYDKNTDCITFPNRDINGNTLFVARRSVKTKYFNYPQGVDKPVYGLYELAKSGETIISNENGFRRFPKYEEIIICESMLDALYFWTIGKYAIALNGLGTQSQFDQLNKLPCRKFILCTDNDDAGMKARQRIRKNLKNKLVTEYILPQERKDANDCTIEELKSLEEIF